MRRDIGNEVVVAIVAVALLAFALTAAVLLSLSTSSQNTDTTATFVSSNVGADTQTPEVNDGTRSILEAVTEDAAKTLTQAFLQLTVLPSASDTALTVSQVAETKVANTSTSQATQIVLVASPTREAVASPAERPTTRPTIAEATTEAPTPTITPTLTSTATDTPTDKPTAVPTNTPTITASPTERPTATDTLTATSTTTDTPVPTSTFTQTPSATDTPSVTPSQTPTDFPTATPTFTSTPTERPTATDTLTATSTTTDTPVPTSTFTQTPSATDTSSVTPSQTATLTNTPTNTPSQTPTNTATNTPSFTPTPTMDFGILPTPTPTQNILATITATEDLGILPTPSETPTETPSLTATGTMGVVPSPTPIPARGDCVLPEGWSIYTVQPDDTLFTLARAVGSTISELTRLNCLEDAALIIAGEQLFVPELPAPPEQTVEPVVEAETAKAIGCADPNAQIIVPVAGDKVRGTFTLLGTASIPDFLYYRVEIRADDEMVYTLYGRYSVAVSRGNLALIDTSALGTGLHWIRLSVVDANGRIPASAVCVVPVEIER